MNRLAWKHWRRRWQLRLLRPWLVFVWLLRWLTYVTAALISLSLLTVALAFLWLLTTQPGGDWLLRQVPGLQVQQFEGSLIRHWRAQQVTWQGEAGELEIQWVRFDWNPLCLLQTQLCLNEVQAASVDFSPSAPQAVESETEPEPLGVDQLPRLDLPMDIRLQRLHLDRLALNGRTLVEALELSADWSSTRLTLHQLELHQPDLQAWAVEAIKARGWIEFDQAWPVVLHAHTQVHQQPLDFSLTGDLARLSLALRSDATLDAQLEGWIEPLNPQRPLDISLNLLDLTAEGVVDLVQEAQLDERLSLWPEALQVSNLHLRFQGQQDEGWQLGGLGRVTYHGEPLNWLLDAVLTSEALTLHQLQLQASTAHHWADLGGAWDWADSQGHLHLRWQTLAQSDFVQALMSDLSLDWSLLDESLSLQLDWRDQALTLGGHASADWFVGPVQLQLETGLTGHLPETALQALRSASVPDSATLPEWLETVQLGGYAQVNAEGHWVGHPFAGVAKADGYWLGPQARYQLSLPQFFIQGLEQDWVALQLSLTELGSSAAISAQMMNLLPWLSHWTLDLQGDLQGGVAVSAPPLLQREDQAWQHPARLSDWLLQGRYLANLYMSELLMDQWQLSQADLELHWGGQAEAIEAQPLTFNFSAQNLQLSATQQLSQLSLDLSGQLQEQRLQVGATLDEQRVSGEFFGGIQLSPGFAAEYRFDDLDLAQFEAWYPDDLRWLGQLSGHLFWSQSPTPSLNLDLDAGSGHWSVREISDLSGEEAWVDLHYDQLTLALKLLDQQLELQLDASGSQLGQIGLATQISLLRGQFEASRPLSGRYFLSDLDIQLLQPFAELDQLEGRLNGEGVISGHLQQPLIEGSLHLTDGLASDLDWPAGLESVDLMLLFQGQNAQLDGHFRSGQRGQGRLQGEVSWPDLTMTLNLSAEQLDVRVEPWARLEVHPQLQLRWQNQVMSLGGQVEVPRGRIRVRELPQVAVKRSDDVWVEGREVSSPAVSQIHMDVELILGTQDLQLDAFGLEAGVQGRLRIGNAMDTRGEVLLVDGIYQSWGQDLRLRRARLTFTGPIELPFLDFEAVREVEDVLVGIRVTGRADQPETEIFSEPAMSNEQALSWLLLGRPLQTESDENALNTLALSLGLRGVSSYTQRLGEAFGVQDFQLITEGDGSDASLVAAGYLNRRLSVRYGVGLYDEISRLAVRYELTRRIYLEAVSSLESSLDLFWRLDY